MVGPGGESALQDAFPAIRTARPAAITVMAMIRRIAESSIWRLAHRHQFPLPIKLSPGCTAWFEHEIDEWLDEKGSKRESAA
jgi:predicted DNA-binding transcriptional regulator AlpA